MNSGLRVEVADTRERTTALTVAGDLDLNTADVLHRTVEGVLRDHRTAILDLTGVTFCDSSGLNALLRLRRHTQETGSRLVLAAPPAQMLRLLTITGAGAIFTVYGSLAEAWEPYPPAAAPPTT
ncbi:STAS domain-containing protein [Streptomyces sp. NPDC057456]|uniref:STAS domain-containing protein n=1 Tax=Streptomyces sp. NPDC057456 TaxID=3346139 RepID=UPI00368CE2B1